MNVTGGCHCQHIKYSARVNPEQVHICHCTDCQKLSGSAFRVNLPTAAKDFKLLQGQLSSYVKTAASGQLRAQLFCGKCGSQIYATSADSMSPDAAIYNLRVGTLDQANQLPPTTEQWLSSKVAWLTLGR